MTPWPDRLHVPLVSEPGGADEIKSITDSDDHEGHDEGDSNNQGVSQKVYQREEGGGGGRGEGGTSKTQIKIQIDRRQKSQKSALTYSNNNQRVH